MTLIFRLECILRMRLQERSIQQQAVASASGDVADQRASRDRIAERRGAVIQEIRVLNDGLQWKVDQVAPHHCQIEQLARELLGAEAQISAAEATLRHAMKQLLLADQSVRALEKLAERQMRIHGKRRSAIEAHETDDALNTIRRVQVGS